MVTPITAAIAKTTNTPPTHTRPIINPDTASIVAPRKIEIGNRWLSDSPACGLAPAAKSGNPVVPIPNLIRPCDLAIYPSVDRKLQAISQKFMNRKESSEAVLDGDNRE